MFVVVGHVADGLRAGWERESVSACEHDEVDVAQGERRVNVVNRRGSALDRLSVAIPLISGEIVATVVLLVVNSQYVVELVLENIAGVVNGQIDGVLERTIADGVLNGDTCLIDTGLRSWVGSTI